VTIDNDVATIAAPQPLSLGAEMPAELLAGCVGLSAKDIVTAHHRPVMASVGNSFVVAEVSRQALGRAVPNLGHFKEAWPKFPHLGPDRLPLYLYAHDGARVRTRMFSPLSGTIEDPATGSAATPLAALLLSLTKDQERRYEILQGVEMGRPSRLLCRAWRAADAIRASVGGGCVPVLEGRISL
jgi:trans-2,3-dihydro-3-hydroxyanthranilate isomerase